MQCWWNTKLKMQTQMQNARCRMQDSATGSQSWSESFTSSGASSNLSSSVPASGGLEDSARSGYWASPGRLLGSSAAVMVYPFKPFFILGPALTRTHLNHHTTIRRPKTDSRGHVFKNDAWKYARMNYVQWMSKWKIDVICK